MKSGREMGSGGRESRVGRWEGNGRDAGRWVAYESGQPIGTA